MEPGTWLSEEQHRTSITSIAHLPAPRSKISLPLLRPQWTQSLRSTRQTPMINLGQILQRNLMVDGMKRRQRGVACVRTDNRSGVLTQLPSHGVELTFVNIRCSRLEHADLVSFHRQRSRAPNDNSNRIEADGHLMLVTISEVRRESFIGHRNRDLLVQ